MADTENQVVYCRVLIKFKTASGYIGETGFPTDGTRGALLAAQELSRILTLNGDSEKLLHTVQQQVQATREWMDNNKEK